MAGTSVRPGEDSVINCFCNIWASAITVQLDITILTFGLEQLIAAATKRFISKGDIQVIGQDIPNPILTIHAIM